MHASAHFMRVQVARALSLANGMHDQEADLCTEEIL